MTTSITATQQSSAALGAQWATKKKKAQGAASDTSSSAEEFLSYAHMNPVQRLRAAYLKSHDLTEEKLASMSPSERQKIEDEIKRFIEQKTKEETENRALRVNLLV